MHARDIQQKAGETADSIRTIGRHLGDSPAAALLAALAVGFAVGLLLRLLEKPAKNQRRDA